MRHTCKIIAYLAFFACVIPAAHADTTFTFVNTTLYDSSPVIGTITIDTVNDISTGANFTAEGDTFNSAGNEFDGYNSCGFGCFAQPTEIQFTANDGNTFLVTFPDISNLYNYAGSALCTYSSAYADCPELVDFGGHEYSSIGFSYYNSFSGGVQVVAGSLAAPQAQAVTPEPSSLVLLGTGILGLAGAARRRLKL